MLTAPDAVTQRLAIEHARSVQPHIEIVARVHNRAQLVELARLDHVRPVQAERELGFAMARQLLQALGASTIEAEATVLSAERGDDGQANPPRLFELAVPRNGAVVGRTLAELGLPASALVVAVVRDGRHWGPRGPTTLAGGDTLLVFAGGDDAREVEAVVRA